eukprot:10618054-Prorocentrum_lima.AAC.1
MPTEELLQQGFPSYTASFDERSCMRHERASTIILCMTHIELPPKQLHCPSTPAHIAATTKRA